MKRGRVGRRPDATIREPARHAPDRPQDPGVGQGGSRANSALRSSSRRSSPRSWGSRMSISTRNSTGGMIPGLGCRRLWSAGDIEGLTVRRRPPDDVAVRLKSFIGLVWLGGLPVASSIRRSRRLWRHGTSPRAAPTGARRDRSGQLRDRGRLRPASRRRRRDRRDRREPARHPAGGLLRPRGSSSRAASSRRSTS